MLLTGVAGIAVITMPLFPQVREIPGWIWIWLGCSTVMVFCCIGLWVDGARMAIWMALALLVIRIAFDLVIIPIRAEASRENVTRASAQRLARIHGDATWYLYGKSFPHEVARCYTSVFADQIIYKTDVVNDPKAYYLVDETLYPDFPGPTIDSLILERGQVLHLKRAAPVR
jgi:hypothetical protein